MELGKRISWLLFKIDRCFCSFFKVFVNKSIKLKYTVVLSIQYAIYLGRQFVSHYTNVNIKKYVKRVRDFFFNILNFTKCSLNLLDRILIYDFLCFATKRCCHDPHLSCSRGIQLIHFKLVFCSIRYEFIFLLLEREGVLSPLHV